MAISIWAMPRPTAATVGDALLQRHGCLVLRFLAEDLGKRLDEVLDATLAALAHRGRSAIRRE